MEHPSELPYDDRSPADGELFSIQVPYWMLRRTDRHEFAHRMLDVVIEERQVVEDVDLELSLRTMGVSPDFQTTNRRREDWRYHVARHMTDEELIEERMRASDHIYRALGSMAMSLKYGGQLMRNVPTIPPSGLW